MSKRKGLKGIVRFLGGLIVGLLLFSFNRTYSKAASNLSLSGDATYNGSDLNGYDGTISLNGHTLTVNGDFTSNATISIGTGGSLIVNGDFTAKKTVYPTGNIEINGSYTQNKGEMFLREGSGSLKIRDDLIFSGSGTISCTYSAFNIVVGGNVLYNSSGSCSNTGFSDEHTSATSYVKGNITQTETSGRFDIGSIILCGENKQVVTLRSNSYIQGLTPQNGNVQWNGYLNVFDLHGDFSPECPSVIKSNSNLGVNGHTLIIPTSFELSNKCYTGTGGKLVVKGNLTTNSLFSAEKGELIVEGDYTQRANNLNMLDNGKVSIGGNLFLTGTGYMQGNGILQIGESLYQKSSGKSDCRNLKMIVKGDIIQDEYTGDFKLGRIEFVGKESQVLSLETNSSIAGLLPTNKDIKIEKYFNNVTLLGDFTPVLNDTLKTSGIESNGFILTINEDVMATGPIRPNKGGTIIINGNLETKDRLGLGDGTLIINGNLIQKGDHIYLDNSNLKITGDVLFTDKGTIIDGDNSSNVLVEGSLRYESNDSVQDSNSTWTIYGNVEQTSGAGSLYFKKLILMTPNTQVYFSNGSAEIIELAAGKTNFTLNPENCYNELIAKISVILDANGGIVNPAEITAKTAEEYGSLPTPTRDGYAFMGWYTEKEARDRVYENTIVEAVDDITLYAHWQLLGSVTMYRLYNPNSGEHFYTSSERERKALAKQGWNDEGFAWEGPSYSNTPVYRLYNENAGDHHYTPSKKERDNLIKQGWKDEGIGWYSDDAKTKPLYRLYNPNAVTGSHHYTTSKKERDNLVKQGWKDEGIGWYGF